MKKDALADFYGLFMRDVRLTQQMTMDESCKKLQDAGIPLQKAALSRMENGRLLVTRPFFEDWCRALNIPFCFEAGNKEKIAQLFENINHSMIHKHPSLDTVCGLFLELDEEEYLNSPLRFSYRILQLILMDKRLYDLDYEQNYKILLKAARTNEQLDVPVVEMDEFALLYYYYEIYLLRQIRDQEARQVLEKSASYGNGKLFHLLPQMCMYQKLRCLTTWENTQEALEEADALSLSFFSRQCFGRCWDVEYLKTTYLVRSGQYDAARGILYRLMHEALWMNNSTAADFIYQNLVWVETAAERWKEVLSVIEQAEEKTGWSTAFYRAFALYHLGEPAQALEILEEDDEKQEAEIFEDHLKKILTLYLQKAPKFTQKAERMIRWFCNSRIWEAAGWTLELLEQHYAETGNLEKQLETARRHLALQKEHLSQI